MNIYDFYRYSGATILASAKWIKDKHNYKQLIIAVPLAPREILEDLNSAIWAYESVKIHLYVVDG